MLEKELQYKIMSSNKNWKQLRVKLEGGFIYLSDLSVKRQIVGQR